MLAKWATMTCSLFLACLDGTPLTKNETVRGFRESVHAVLVGSINPARQRKTGDLGQIAALAFGEDEEKLEAYQG